jgi:ABC-type uncharacterized transport system substrate-binding protein
VATLKEIETHWSLDDVVTANGLLDVQGEINAITQKIMDGVNG